MQQDPNYFQTIEKNTIAEFTDRGSRFIAYAFPVVSIDEFKIILQKLKKEQPKASHHCFAYRIGSDGLTYRVSDAGEPAGSAGRPILGQIDSKGLTNVCVIVVRFFGGTLLGIPGLINAYKSASSMALQLTPVVKKNIEVEYELQFDYTISNEVMKVVRGFDCSIKKQEMQLFCLYEIGIPKINEQDCVRLFEEIYGCSIKKKSDSGIS
jgi:uncharacterized YigZ family protein